MPTKGIPMALIGGRLLNEADEGRKPVKGICTNCKRKDIGIAPLKPPLCWTCYTAAKGLKGEEREKALAEVRDKLIKADIEKVGDALKKRAESGAEAEISREDPGAGILKVGEKAEIPAPKPHRTKGTVKEIHIAFSKDDVPIYDYLTDVAKRNRRTLQAQVLYILDIHKKEKEARERL